MATVTDRLEHTWESPHTLAATLASVDHKVIGIRYIVTALIFFVLAGVGALVMRLQLAEAENTLLTPELYNQLFSMHGTVMIFFFATPILSGFGNYLVPLMIGARDMAFPRLNAFAYWIFLFSGLFMLSSFLIGAAPHGGWYAYVPYSDRTYSPGLNMDFWALGLIFLGLGTTAGAINFIVTIFKMRAPGMSINRVPLFVWALLTAQFAVVVALPTLTAACLLLELDRKLGTPFFLPELGGSPLLWQHLFWFFGHPDVYIIFLPAVGMVSMIIPTFARRPIVGYTWVALAAVTTGMIGFGVWVHHMFPSGLPTLSLSFFSAASMSIAIPSAVQIFAWIATIGSGQPVFKPPFLFALGFIVLFIMGGVTGVMVGVVPFDWQVTDSYFVVAHFHYVLIGGAVFPIFGGLYYWLPKMTGRMLSERLGTWTFWIMFWGFNLAFFPMHIVGILGMPRRVYTYSAGLGWDWLNLLETIGAFLFAFGILLFIVDFLKSRRAGEPAGDNPWNANTLEWSTTSPPPVYNFRIIPEVHSRDPLWNQGQLAPQNERDLPEHLLLHGRKTLGTTLLDATPQAILQMPGDSWWPLLLSLALTWVFVAVLLDLWIIAAVGVVLTLAALAGWFWPKEQTA